MAEKICSSIFLQEYIQPGNVLRAMDALGILDRHVDAGAGFDFVEVHAPDGTRLARVPSPRLLKAYAANLGISRRALQHVLAAAGEAGTVIRFCITVDTFEDRGECVAVRFFNGVEKAFDLLVRADGAYSQASATIFPQARTPASERRAIAIIRAGKAKTDFLASVMV